MLRLGIVIVICLMSLQSSAVAQQDPPTGGKANRRLAEIQRRDWVRNQLAKLLPDPQQRAEINSQLDNLTDDQIQVIANLCLDELEARRKQQLQLLRESNAREREFQAELARRLPFEPGFMSPSVGFIPVITWLPEGASLSAHAVVSPDRRHVRLAVVPFFSTIGPVYTFNYMTGETRRYDP